MQLLEKEGEGEEGEEEDEEGGEQEEEGRGGDSSICSHMQVSSIYF